MALAAIAFALFTVATAPDSGLSAVSGARDSLQLRLVIPPTAVAGRPVSLRFSIENQAGRTLDLYLRGRTATFDVTILDATGRVVWRRLEGEVIPAILHLRTVAPGERVGLEAVWDQRTTTGARIAPGVYSAFGELLVEGEPLVTPVVTFRILPP